MIDRFLYQLFHLSYTIQKWSTRQFTTSGLVVLCCLAFSAIFGLDTKQAMAYQIFSFLLSILVMAIAWGLFFRFRFSATRILPRFGTVGVKLEYRIVIHNRTDKIQKGLKLWENLADPRPSFSEFRETLETAENKLNFLDICLKYQRWLGLIARQQGATAKKLDLPPLAPNSKTEVVVAIEPTHRGPIRLTGLTIACPDPFGLFNACKTLSLPESLWILPKLYQLPLLPLPGTRKYQSGGVALASSVGDSEEFISLRDYRPGDPLRKIHWKSWAKTGKPIVKEEQDHFFIRHALILDTFHQEQYSDLLEEALSVAASFAYDFHSQESLLDLMFVGTEAYCFTSGRGVGHTNKMLEIIAAVKACQDKSFAYLTSIVISRASMLSGCICIFLTWDLERGKLVNYLRQLKIPTLVLLIAEAQNTSDEIELDQREDRLGQFHLLKLGKIQEGLMKL
jgi:hypothetical protein